MAAPSSATGPSRGGGEAGDACAVPSPPQPPLPSRDPPPSSPSAIHPAAGKGAAAVVVGVPGNDWPASSCCCSCCCSSWCGGGSCCCGGGACCCCCLSHSSFMHAAAVGAVAGEDEEMGRAPPCAGHGLLLYAAAGAAEGEDTAVGDRVHGWSCAVGGLVREPAGCSSPPSWLRGQRALRAAVAGGRSGCTAAEEAAAATAAGPAVEPEASAGLQDSPSAVHSAAGSPMSAVTGWGPALAVRLVRWPAGGAAWTGTCTAVSVCGRAAGRSSGHLCALQQPAAPSQAFAN